MNERYDVVRELGRGSQGVTYLARDRQTGDEVALKVLGVADAHDWKALELFEREIQALRDLDHPGIPRYLGDFELEDSTRVLVQEYVDGASLADRLASGGSFAPGELDGVARQLLSIAGYIHARTPPVVHRDIKPANILSREDGSIALVDFGGVQTRAPSELGGSTVVGTSGYMPVEQIMGHASPASDLYAIGATLAHLHSGVHPSKMGVREMRLDFEPYVRASPSMLALMRALLEPDVAHRPASAEDALTILEGSTRALVVAADTSVAPAPSSTALSKADELSTWPELVPERGLPIAPEGTIVKVEQEPGVVTVRVPGTGPTARAIILLSVLVLGPLGLGSALLFTNGLAGLGLLLVCALPALLFGYIFVSSVGSASIARTLTLTPDALDITDSRGRSLRLERDQGLSVGVATLSPSPEMNEHGMHVLTFRGPGEQDVDVQGLYLQLASTIYVAGIARNWAEGTLFDDHGDVMREPGLAAQAKQAFDALPEEPRRMLRRL